MALARREASRRPEAYCTATVRIDSEKQRLNAHTHLAILLGKEHRPVDLWATRLAELPTSPTGLHYDGFSLTSSTRNDEEPLGSQPYAQP